MPTMVQEREYYLTEQGLIRLKAEYQHLRKLKSAKITGEVPKVWHSEDLNPEYLSFQEDVGFLEARLTDLEKVLRTAKLIKTPPKTKRDMINLGATVAVEVDGNIDEFTIVGSLEANPSLGKISNESPVGKALLGRRIGDEVIISSPIQVLYKVKKIRYSS